MYYRKGEHTCNGRNGSDSLLLASENEKRAAASRGYPRMKRDWMVASPKSSAPFSPILVLIRKREE